MPIEQSERNWLEKLADAIPGIAGYRAKEGRRDTDKRLRDYLAGLVEESLRGVERAREARFKSGGLDGLDAFGRLANSMRALADCIRYASQGYSGFFDQIKVRETELDELYHYDLELMDSLKELRKSVETAPEALQGLENQVEAIRKKVEGRKTLLHRIPGGGA